MSAWQVRGVLCAGLMAAIAQNGNGKQSGHEGHRPLMVTNYPSPHARAPAWLRVVRTSLGAAPRGAAPARGLTPLCV